MELNIWNVCIAVFIYKCVEFAMIVTCISGPVSKTDHGGSMIISTIWLSMTPVANHDPLGWFLSAVVILFSRRHASLREYSTFILTVFTYVLVEPICPYRDLNRWMSSWKKGQKRLFQTYHLIHSKFNWFDGNEFSDTMTIWINKHERLGDKMLTSTKSSCNVKISRLNIMTSPCNDDLN